MSQRIMVAGNGIEKFDPATFENGFQLVIVNSLRQAIDALIR